MWISTCCVSVKSREFDLRAPEMCKTDRPQNVLVNLNEHIGPHAEAKCLSINPVRPELLAVGANDPYVRLYDRRMLHCRGITFPAETASRLVPWLNSFPAFLVKATLSCSLLFVSRLCIICSVIHLCWWYNMIYYAPPP